jgi:hypothetical protein
VRVIRLVLVICIAALIVIGLAIRSFENTLFGILAVAGFWGFLWFVRYAMRAASGARALSGGHRMIWLRLARRAGIYSDRRDVNTGSRVGVMLPPRLAARGHGGKSLPFARRGALSRNPPLGACPE